MYAVAQLGRMHGGHLQGNLYTLLHQFAPRLWTCRTGAKYNALRLPCAGRHHFQAGKPCAAGGRTTSGRTTSHQT